MHDLDRAVDALQQARRVAVLTGAGASTESGIPDFRSESGIWSRFSPSDFEYSRFLRDPKGFWELRARLMVELDLENARPNATHEAIARASRSDRFLGHVSQNIDGLFHDAHHEPRKLVEVHGSARSVRCISCRSFFPYSAARESVARGHLPPECPSCKGVLKPGTILFGESLHAPDIDQAAVWARHCDAMVVVGSSLAVHPVAALPSIALDAGASLVIINDGPTPYDSQADAVVRGKAGSLVPPLLLRMGLTRD